MISSEYTRCYGLFRELFLITGKSLHKKGLLDNAEDVFYLTLKEHNKLMEASLMTGEARDFRQKLDEVKKEMGEYSEVILPSVIYGDVPPPLPRENGRVLEGIPTSPLGPATTDPHCPT